jgi:rare lipoprotein A
MKDKLAIALLCLAFTGGVWSAPVLAEEGTAVYYSDIFQGRPTASGDIFDQKAMTAAYKGLPFGTKVTVTNLENGKSVVVTINDRMASGNRNIIDVSRTAAQELGFEEQGTVRVSVERAQ